MSNKDNNETEMMENAKLKLVQQQIANESWTDLTLRELLGQLLSSVASAERNVYLEQNPEDKGNGYYTRGLTVGSLPLEMMVPRSRSGDFRPLVLPPKHHRGFAEETQNILLSLLASSRSISAAKVSLARLGLPFSESDLNAVVQEVLQDFNLKNSRPLDTDMLGLFIDAKYLEVRKGDSLKPMTLYLAIGLSREGKKRILACIPEEGRESLEGWKKLIRNLINRGLRRPLIVVQDDFSGLSNLVKGFFPKAHVQLCTVHMLRNAKTHLNKSDFNLFIEQFRSIMNSWNPDQAHADFNQLCEDWKDKYPSFMQALNKKRSMYLACLNFPQKLRKTFATTNMVEVINRQFEKIRLNNSGYFQSLDDLQLKLNLSIQNLEQGRWKNPSGSTQQVLSQINSLFIQLYEEDLNLCA